MRHDQIGLGPLLLYGGVGALISTGALALKSTGKPTSGVKMIPLNGPYARFGLQIVKTSTVASSGFGVTIIGSMTSGNPNKLGSSQFTALVKATSATLNKIVLSTATVPVSWIGVRSTKLTTSAGAKYKVFLTCLPT